MKVNFLSEGEISSYWILFLLLTDSNQRKRNSADQNIESRVWSENPGDNKWTTCHSFQTEKENKWYSAS